MNKKKIVSSFLGLATVGLIGIVWLNFQPIEDPIEQKIAPKTVSATSQNDSDTDLKTQAVASGINNKSANTKEVALIQNESSESSVQFIKDAKLIAEIEKDMGYSPRPEGDLSYMSPANETVQPEFVDFPAEEPEDPNATLGQSVSGPAKIGTPYKEDSGS